MPDRLRRPILRAMFSKYRLSRSDPEIEAEKAVRAVREDFEQEARRLRAASEGLTDARAALRGEMQAARRDLAASRAAREARRPGGPSDDASPRTARPARRL
ncbi:MAG: hypothetical protein AAF676_17375 [Pseudomonadota bacterium]